MSTLLTARPGTRLSTAARVVGAVIAIVAALLVQVTVLPAVAPLLTWHGIGPGLVLVTVVAIALVSEPRFATWAGFGGGLLLDLAPPADHLAGRWALALLVVGYVVSRVGHDQRAASGIADPLVRPPWAVVGAAAAAGSFVGTTAFVLTGLVLGDQPGGLGGLLEVVGVGVVWDAAVSFVVVPLVVALLTRLARRRDGERLTPRVAQRTRVG